MKTSVFIPDDFHSVLRVIGGLDWLRITDSDGTRTNFDINYGLLDKTVAAMGEPDRRYFQALWKSPLQKPILEMLGKFLHSGPKVFRVSAEQCRAMENVEIHLETADYRQAYPVIAIELPAAYARERNVPQHILCRHWAEENQIFLLAGNVVQSEKKCFDMLSAGLIGTIEEKLNRHVVNENTGMEYDMRQAWRIALNCNLLLTNFETRLRNGPERERLLQKAKRNNPEKRAHAQRLLEKTAADIEFTQTIRFYDETHETAAGESNPTGRTVRSHWRKGHWRRQVCGAGRAGRKNVFIKPVLVHADTFTGETAQTFVNYIGK